MSRGDSRPGKRYGGPWYGQSSDLIRFVGGARQAFPGLRYRAISKLGFEVRVQLDVPHNERRNVRILFERWSPRYPIVTADGPTDSRHRNGDGTPCLWYPDDDEDRRWVFSYGLTHLLGIITLHLFKEAWWREAGGFQGGEWVGDGVHSEAPKKNDPPRDDDDAR
jgi:hypothetical protein